MTAVKRDSSEWAGRGLWWALIGARMHPPASRTAAQWYVVPRMAESKAHCAAPRRE